MALQKEFLHIFAQENYLKYEFNEEEKMFCYLMGINVNKMSIETQTAIANGIKLIQSFEDEDYSMVNEVVASINRGIDTAKAAYTKTTELEDDEEEGDIAVACMRDLYHEFVDITFNLLNTCTKLQKQKTLKKDTVSASAA